MRISRPLCKQHIGHYFKKIWATQSARKIRDTGLEQKLLAKGVPVVRAEELMRAAPPKPKIDIVGLRPPSVAFNHTHPNWHDRALLTYRDDNVLLEGLSQAKILTNTVELKRGLPEGISLQSSKKIDRRVKDVILSAHVFDAQQVKLPKLRDPERPAFKFARVWGVGQPRAIKLLLQNLLQLVENTSDFETVKQRHITEDTRFSYNFERGDDLIQFELTGDILTSTSPLRPATNEPTDSLNLPDIRPIKATITLTQENIYEVRGIYPINLKFPKSHPHTIFVPQIEAEVKNLYEEAVTETQIFGRSLLKSFTVAASYAKEKFGDDVKVLPKPVTIQCVHTDGKLFHFGIFQLNTLDLEGTGVKNVWYQTERIPLFESCCYKVGRPVLEGYNSQVVQYLNALYNNV